MARIIGGIGASHSPTIGFAKDTGKQNDPAWKPIFDGFDAIRGWVQDKKIDVIKVVREITALGLKEAKDLVEAGGKAVKEGVTKAEAEEIKKKLTAVGAEVEVK